MRRPKIDIFSFMAKSTAVLLPKQHIFIFLVALFVCSFATRNAVAQFNPTSNTTLLDLPTPDTLAKVIPESHLNLQVYNEAYDKYLRKLRSKQRNTFILDPASGMTFTQTALGNWAAGGNNQMSIRGYLLFQHKYQAPIYSNTITFNGIYAFVNTDKIMRKSEDLLRFTVSPEWKIAPRWKLTSQADLLTQFSNSYQAPGDTILTSGLLSPGTLTAALGITYAPPAGKAYITVFLSPITGRLIMVLNQELADKGVGGMKDGRNYKADFGARLEIKAGYKFYKDKLTFTTHLISMWDYNYTPNLDWTARLDMKFTTLFSCNFYIRGIYDEKIPTPRSKEGERKFLQINQSFGFGITYGFTSKKPPVPPENKYLKTRIKR